MLFDILEVCHIGVSYQWATSVSRLICASLGTVLLVTVDSDAFAYNNQLFELHKWRGDR